METSSGDIRQQIANRLQQKENNYDLNEAKRKSLRMKVHSEVITSRNQYHQGQKGILEWIKKEVLSNDESFKSLNGLIIPPFPTNELHESIYSDVSRIFTTPDFYQKLNWSGASSKNDQAKQFLKQIGCDDFWEQEAVNAYKVSPESFIVCDKPKKDSDKKDPYFYILDIEKVKSACFKKAQGTQTIEWIAFSLRESKIAYFDERHVAVFDESKNTFDDGFPLEHNVGWCPVFPLWQTKINASSEFQKSSRSTKSISELDWLFFYEYAKKWQDLCNPFPIWAMYDHRCTYEDKETGSSCDRGYLNYTIEGVVHQKICPSCATRFRRGPDRIIKVPAPQSSEDPDLMRSQPVQPITADVANMDYVTKEIERLNNKIYKNCAGMDFDFVKKQAINEDQVHSMYESRKSILLWEKRNFDVVRNNVTKTLLKMKFGESFAGCETDHGECWYLQGEENEIDSYKKAKESHLPLYDLKVRRESMIDSKFRNNPEKVERVRIMAIIEPFPDMNIKEMAELKTAFPGLVSDADFVVKENFSNFIDMFESENGPISSFGKDLKGSVTDDGVNSDKIRIDKIKSIIYNYAKTKKSSATAGNGAGAGE